MKSTLIQSSEIRDAVTPYYGVLNFHDLQRRENLERAPDVMGLASDHLTLRYDPDQPLGYATRVDWPRARDDRTLLLAVHRVMGNQIVFHQRRKNVLEQSLVMCRLLDEALGRTCEPPDWINDESNEESRS